MHQHHLVAGNVDQLVVVGSERTDRKEPVLGELVERQQPLAVGFLGSAHGGVVVARLIMDIELLHDGIDFLALERLTRLVDVPFHDLAVDEHRRIGVAAAVERRVQRPQSELRLGDHDVARFDLVIEEARRTA